MLNLLLRSSHCYISDAYGRHVLHDLIGLPAGRHVDQPRHQITIDERLLVGGATCG